MTQRTHIINFNLIVPEAVLPSPVHEGDVGFDLHSLEDVNILPRATGIVHTGVALAESPLPVKVGNCVLSAVFPKIEGRSGLALKGIFPVGGIIDPTYRGEIMIVLFNSTSKTVKLTKDKPMAQLVFYSAISTVDYNFVVKPNVSEVLSQTDRGSAGFGSTDNKK